MTDVKDQATFHGHDLNASASASLEPEGNEGRLRHMEPVDPARVEGPSLEPDPVIEAYKKDVDRSLIRENLRRTPDERMRALVALQRFATELRRAGREAAAH